MKFAGCLMTERDQILEQALALGPEDRAYVADALEQSLGGGQFASPEIAAAWAEEIEHRIAAYDRGEMQAAGIDVAMERIREHLHDHRRRKATP